MPEEEAVQHEATDPEKDQLRNALAAAQSRNAEYESMLLDPSYVDYIASRGRGTAAPAKQQETSSAEEPADVATMTPAQLRKMIRDAASEVVQETQQAGRSADATVQVRKLLTDHPDARNYAREMIALAGAFPDWTAEDVYQKAKEIAPTLRKTNGIKAAEPKAAAPKSEAPSGHEGKAEVKKPKGVANAVQLAWKQMGLKGDRL